jgi:hypothetical protein
MEQEFQKLLSHFYQFAKSRIGFDKEASIQFISDPQNSVELLGKTAYYDPSQMSVTIYTDRRHPKDILRSVAHELVHHKQNCDGKMDNLNPTTPGYAQEDSHLRGLEEEAYLEGNMCFRDWEDNYKTNQEVKTIYESVTTKFTKEKLKMSTRSELRSIVKEAVTKVLSGNRLNEMDYGYHDEEDPYKDPYFYELEKEFPFLKDDPEMGGRAPAHVQRSMDDEMPADEGEVELEEFSRMDSLQGSSAMEKAFAAVDLSTLMSIALPYLNDDEKEILKDEMLKIVMVIPDAELGDVYDAVVAQGVDEASTDKHDDNPALKGGQDSLPDELQKAIIGGEEEANEAIEDDITSSEDRYGDMKHIIKGIRFSSDGDIAADVRKMEENEELADWLYGELGSDDVIADEFGNEYAGIDVQDHLNTDDVVLPDIAETQEDFYSQMRTDARTISEDWNKSARNKRSALLNERLMKAWNFKK